MITIPNRWFIHVICIPSTLEFLQWKWDFEPKEGTTVFVIILNLACEIFRYVKTHTDLSKLVFVCF